MNYEKIIVELLGRIQVLEEKVSALMEEQQKKEEKKNAVTTDEVREYIRELKRKSKESGKERVVLRAGNIHNELGLKQRHPMVCNAMRQCMQENDVILFQTPSGNSSTLEIEYKL